MTARYAAKIEHANEARCDTRVALRRVVLQTGAHDQHGFGGSIL
jgi:hypothetical protein